MANTDTDFLYASPGLQGLGAFGQESTPQTVTQYLQQLAAASPTNSILATPSAGNTPPIYGSYGVGSATAGGAGANTNQYEQLIRALMANQAAGLNGNTAVFGVPGFDTGGEGSAGNDTGVTGTANAGIDAAIGGLIGLATPASTAFSIAQALSLIPPDEVNPFSIPNAINAMFAPVDSPPEAQVNQETPDLGLVNDGPDAAAAAAAANAQAANDAVAADAAAAAAAATADGNAADASAVGVADSVGNEGSTASTGVGEGATSGSADGSTDGGGGDGGGGGGGGGKIVCTAMNTRYGFGQFRNRIWLRHSAKLAPEYQVGYHAIFGPLVKYAYSGHSPVQHAVAQVLEHIARHRTADIWAESRGRFCGVGRIYRAVLEPICYLTGRILK